MSPPDGSKIPSAHPAEPEEQREPTPSIDIFGARQNNLKNITVSIPGNELVVVTGVSGSGKSSLVFDTLYAEGQRRYVETFSPYARQFLDRQDRPQVDRIDGIPPAIAIDQTNPVRTSRSTVGTMTELNDHLKLLFARASQLFCKGCGVAVKRDSAHSICDDMQSRANAFIAASLEDPPEMRAALADVGDARVLITFPVEIPPSFKAAEVEQLLAAQGYTRIHARTKDALEVVQDRMRAIVVAKASESPTDRTRIIEALEAALRVGKGRVNVRVVPKDESAAATPMPEDAQGTGISKGSPSAKNADIVWRFSADLHCPDCDIHYADPMPSLFSFNSPVGACESCRGFGRVIGIDFGLIVPDESKTLRQGAVKPWQTPSFHECQDDIEKYAKLRNIPLDTPWRDLTDLHRRWVLEGEPEWVSWKKSFPGTWYGVRIFFNWLETKAYKMHIRVLLSKYRAYTPCLECHGARLKPDALAWRLGSKQDADETLADDKGRYQRFMPLFNVGRVKSGLPTLDEKKLQTVPGLCVHDLMLLPIERLRSLIDGIHLPAPLDEATDLLLTEIRARLKYLCDVGLAYLTLDRQSRTLSGGEVQRINLTTALGTSLVNTLFVLDEPSIGLHPRDMGRIIGVMHRLRDAGNSVVVVEHDPQIMFEADRIMDMGPGPGERGGEIVFFGTPEELRHSNTLTADYLSGRKHVDGEHQRDQNPRALGGIDLSGVTEHNLKNVDVHLPFGQLVCITGVSGSGKSTLIQDVLYAALRKTKGQPTETPGAHRELRGHEHIDDVVMVDQTPIGRTARSNPASYVGAWDAIRAQYARTALAKERSYTQGTFSFNSGTGRCATCSGSGFEHVEMQFLSDVYLRCPDCDGRRFRGEVLDVTVRGRSIADTLELTVSEALHFFSLPGEEAIAAALRPLVEVGLEYVKLGQPVPTLSGGEAQRLKLAGHLADAAKTGVALSAGGKLFLFDEPTTGLHFDDIAKLLRAFRRLIDAGHSLVVIEHNLDVIAASDWIIDLGPEGGDRGGEIVATGTPDAIKANPRSHTGIALKDYAAALAGYALGKSQSTALLAREQMPEDARQLGIYKPLAPVTGAPVGTQPLKAAVNAIRILHAREHNLQNISVDIPRNRFTVITGVSGSGKSTLAFDILFNEGQRRYLESLNAYARQFVQPSARPDVDAIFGIPPTVAIEQRTSRGGRKSTVATLTEIYHFLRLLYVKLGTQYCPDCHVAIEPQSFEAISAKLMKDYRGQRIGILAPLVFSRKGYYTDLAKWAKGKGYDYLRVDGEFVPTAKWPRLDRFKEHTIELPVADLIVSPSGEAELRRALTSALEFGRGNVHVLGRLDQLATAWERARGITGNHARQTPAPGNVEADLPLQVFSTKRACPSCGRSFPEPDPRLFSFNSPHGWCGGCFGTGVMLKGYRADDDISREQEDRRLDDWIDSQTEADEDSGEPGVEEPCTDCHGQRLNPVARAVRFREQSITQLVALPVNKLADFFERLTGLQEDTPQAKGSSFPRKRESSVVQDSQSPWTPAFAGVTANFGNLPGAGTGVTANLSNAPESKTAVTAHDAPTSREAAIARDILAELKSRLAFLNEVGLSYLSLDRAAPTLSGGEAQRIRLASQLGSNLRGVCYILDEPTIGLHPRDNRVLLDTLEQLEKKGNTLVVVEHDEDTIRRAAHVIDIGPGAGKRGGHIVAQGTAAELMASPDSVTGRFLKHPLLHPLHPPRPVTRTTPVIGLKDITLHNIRGVDIDIPLARLTVFTGVSGSGKSTVARNVLHGNLARLVASTYRRDPGEIPITGAARIEGWQQIGRVLEVDQTPIGKTPRSCPATYVGFWDAIRKLFADANESRMRGWKPNRFSFNTGEGRCPGCEGQGVKRIEMSFLPDVKVLCEACRGARFNPETLSVLWRGKSIGDVLAMNVDEAVEFFSAHPAVHHALRLLQDVGLGYLTLGQQSPSLSGGEAQRIKLVTELSKVRLPHPNPPPQAGEGAKSASPSSNPPPQAADGYKSASLSSNPPPLAGEGRVGAAVQSKVPASRQYSKIGQNTLYVLDEPTVGLHMADVDKLIRVLHRLVDAGNTVVVVEHNLDVMADADWIIDMGPEGGDAGGKVAAMGPPPALAAKPDRSPTSRVLAEFLQTRSRAPGT